MHDTKKCRTFIMYYNVYIKIIMNDKKIELISAKGAMGVTEFALLYFPESPPETAYKRMWVWIRTSRGLKEKLLAAGWVKFQKLYTPKQVACLVEHLGEP